MVPNDFLRKVLWFFFLASILTYVEMCFLLEAVVLDGSSGGFVFEDGEVVPSLIFYGFIAAAVFALVLQFVLPNKIKDPFARDLLRYACFEMVGVLGFTLFLFGGHYQEPLVFIGVAFIGMLSVFPRNKAL